MILITIKFGELLHRISRRIFDGLRSYIKFIHFQRLEVSLKNSVALRFFKPLHGVSKSDEALFNSSCLIYYVISPEITELQREKWIVENGGVYHNEA